MADLPGEPGWYRLTDHGWEPVDDDQAEAEIMHGGGRDLIHVVVVTEAEPTLF